MDELNKSIYSAIKSKWHHSHAHRARCTAHTLHATNKEVHPAALHENKSTNKAEARSWSMHTFQIAQGNLQIEFHFHDLPLPYSVSSKHTPCTELVSCNHAANSLCSQALYCGCAVLILQRCPQLHLASAIHECTLPASLIFRHHPPLPTH